MPPSQVRWMRRYDGGRLSLVASVNAGTRGLLTRSNCARIHSRVKRNALDPRRLDEGREVVQDLLRVDLRSCP